MLVGGVASSGGDAVGVIAVGSCTGGGRCVQGFCDVWPKVLILCGGTHLLCCCS